mmetsp:Transcript_1173/g.1387  ORF Transcript_1173/g.1387 Transcript_1173/m.1387 type:complete len:506 (-) Transcript_1173:305-1822(-)
MEIMASCSLSFEAEHCHTNNGEKYQDTNAVNEIDMEANMTSSEVATSQLVPEAGGDSGSSQSTYRASQPVPESLSKTVDCIESNQEDDTAQALEDISKPWLLRPTSKLVSKVSEFIEFSEKRIEEGYECNHYDMEYLERIKAWRRNVNILLGYCDIDSPNGNYIDQLEVPFRRARCLHWQRSERRYEMISLFRSSQAFVLANCLQKVEQGYERREVWLARAAEIMQDGSVTLVNRDAVVKKVGKIAQGATVDGTRYNHLLCREFKTQHYLGKLNHPNILPLHFILEDDEYMYAGTPVGGPSNLMEVLSYYVTEQPRHVGFPVPVVRNLMRHAATGLVVSHNCGIAHRDVSLENMVVENREDLLHTNVSLIDWGHSCGVFLCNKQSGEFERIPHEGPIGKLKYLAPELMSNLETYDPFASDVFALGVCFFSLLVGRMPFKIIQDNHAQILQRSASSLIEVMRPNLHLENVFSRPAIDLLNQLLAWSPENRISSIDILSHPFFAVDQ